MKKRLYLVGLNSSPRFRDNPGAQQDSTTRFLLDYALSYAQKKSDVLLIDLYKLNIKECNGCFSTDENLCNPNFQEKFKDKEGIYDGCRCFDDDFKKIEKEILKSDGVIFASPVNYGMPNPKILSVFNRLTAIENCVRLEGKILEFPMMYKTAGAIATSHHTGASKVCQDMLSIANDFGFVIPPYSYVYHQGDHFKSTFLNKEILVDKANILFKNLEAMVDNMLVLSAKIKGIKWNLDYIDDSEHPISQDEAKSKFDYNKELIRYLDENWDEMLQKSAKKKDVNLHKNSSVPSLP